jgi:hypothetical protein
MEIAATDDLGRKSPLRVRFLPTIGLVQRGLEFR